MDASRRPSSYDLFKLTVAVLLLIFFLLFLRRTAPQALVPAPTSLSPTAFVSPGPLATQRANSTNILGTTVSVSLTPTVGAIEDSAVTGEVEETGTAESTVTDSLSAPSATSVGASTPTSLPSPTATNLGAPTETPLPSPTATNPAARTATPLPTQTSTPEIQSTPIPAETPSVMTACEAAASRSQLQTGTSARILRRLNFRSSPGIRDNWLRTNIPGILVEVVDGPECVPHLAGAYVWWQIKLPNGEIGWSAEGSIHGSFYFMETAR